MDSRTPTELIFDMGLGDLLNVCIAGSATLGPRSLASIEYGCAAVGAKLIVVMGHTHSAVIETAMTAACAQDKADNYGQHFHHIVDEIKQSMDAHERAAFPTLVGSNRQATIDGVSHRHILRSVQELPRRSETIRALIADKRVAIVGAMYDTQTGQVHFMVDNAIGPIQSVQPETVP
jgi:carbonic anhydrase/SulP family sulfate permease